MRLGAVVVTIAASTAILLVASFGNCEGTTTASEASARAASDRATSAPAIETQAPELKLEPDVSAIFPNARNTAISPNGKKLLIIDTSDNVTVVDIPSGKYIRTSIPFEWHRGQCCITDEGKVVSVGYDGTINGQDKGLPRIAPIVFFDKGSKFVAQIKEGRDTIVVDVASGTVLKKCPIQMEAAVLEVTPDGKSIFARGWPSKDHSSVTAIVIDTTSDSKTQETFDCSQNLGLSFSPDGRTIALSYRDRLDFWSVKDKKVVKTVKGWQQVYGYTSKGNLMIGAGTSLQLWDADMSRQIAKTDATHGNNTGWTISEDGKTAFLNARICDLETGKVLLPREGQHARFYVSLVFQKDLILAADADGVVWQWRLTASNAKPLNKGTGMSPGKLIVTPDGPQFISVSKDGTVRIFDLDHKEIRTLKTPADSYLPFPRALSPDRSLIAMSDYKGIGIWSCPGNAFRRINIFDQDPPDVHRPPPLAPLSLAISPDNKYVAAGWTAVGVYDILSGSDKPVLQIDPAPEEGAGRSSACNVLGFSPNGRLIAIGYSSPRTIRIYDAGSGEIVVAYPRPKNPYTIAFSPESDRLAFAENDATISIWRIPQSPARHDKPDPVAIRDLWRQVGSEDAKVAYAAMNALVAAGSDAVASQPLAPTPGAFATKDVEILIRNLDDDNWKIRDEAGDKLVNLGPAVMKQAIATYEKTQSAEVKARLAEVLMKVGPLTLTDKGELLAARVVHVLEIIGDDKAFAALEKIAAGGASRQSLDAVAALARLKARR